MGKQLTVNSANAHFMPTKSKQTARLTPGPSKSWNPKTGKHAHNGTRESV